MNPRSITACLRLDIFSKKRLWQLNYDCVGVSTELPTIPSNGTMSTTTAGTTKMGGMSTTMSIGMTSAMTTSQITTTTTMMTTTIKSTERTTSRDVEVITVPGNESTTVVDIDK